MARFTFETTPVTWAFCVEIARSLMAFGNLSQDDAVSLVNVYWGGAPFDDDDDLRFHEEAYYWAMSMLHGGRGPLPIPGNRWWKVLPTGADRPPDYAERMDRVVWKDELSH
jgi:hypothetical protein